MPAMPLPAEKDAILLKLDLYTKFSSPDRLKQFRDDLDVAPRDAAEVFAKRVCLKWYEKNHMNDWLDNPFDWQDVQGATPGDPDALYNLFQRRLRKALKRIMTGGSNEGLPLDAYWVCYPDQGPQVRGRIRLRADGHAVGFDLLTPVPHP